MSTSTKGKPGTARLLLAMLLSMALPRSRGPRRNDTGASPIKDIAVGFILIGISLVVALTILPVITSAVNTAQTDNNTSSADRTLLGLLPTLLIVGLIAGGVAFLFKGFKKIM